MRPEYKNIFISRMSLVRMIAHWIIMVGLVILALLFLKAEESTKIVKILIVIFLGFVVYLSITGLFMSNKVDLNSPRGIFNAVYVYFGWLGQTTSTLWDIGTDTASMVGNAIKVNSSEDYRRR